MSQHGEARIISVTYIAAQCCLSKRKRVDILNPPPLPINTKIPLSPYLFLLLSPPPLLIKHHFTLIHTHTKIFIIFTFMCQIFYIHKLSIYHVLIVAWIQCARIHALSLSLSFPPSSLSIFTMFTINFLF